MKSKDGEGKREQGTGKRESPFDELRAEEAFPEDTSGLCKPQSVFHNPKSEI